MRRLPAILLTAALCTGAQPLRIVLVGDSTVNDEGGWGTGFRASFGAPVEVINHALNGRSSKSFRDEGHWQPVLDANPKYVLIQFGHNDGPGKGPERETDPDTTYRANMTRYIGEVRKAGATPVLVTSIIRRNFDAQGKIRSDSLFPYVAATRKLAKELGVGLIDLYEQTLAQAEKLGATGAETLGRKDPNGKLDTTHLSAKGQQDIGIMAAREFTHIAPEVKPYFHELVSWRDAMRQPASWYSGVEAIRIADNLLLYQHEIGGWDKNIDESIPLGPKDRADVEQAKREALTTIDNGATYTEMEFLAKVWAATGDKRYAAAFQRGLEYLFQAQYGNGGWPQFYPLRDGYWSHITYNDDAMIGVMELLRSVAAGKPAYAFIGDPDRRRAAEAVRKGIECILKTQVVQNGELTAWCAQHDEHTLAPAKARSYELPSLSGSEGVGIVRFLMEIDRPSPDVIRSIQGAVRWFSANKIMGLRLVRQSAPGTPKGYDEVVAPDPNAPQLWARFYELGTNRPIFCGRDGVVKYQLSEIEYERRNGYRWYVDRPAKLLDVDYPKWLAKWAPGQDARIK